MTDESSITDEDLMERLQRDNDSLALETLVRRYERPLYAYACRVTGSREAAQDVFQETFIRIYRKRTSFRLGARFRPWVYQICLNLCRDHLRKRKRRPEQELPETPVVDPGPSPHDQAARKLLERKVREAVEELPEKHREVFMLAHYEQLSYPEVAAVLGLPLGTVKSRMFHCMRKLADLLANVEAP